MLLPGGGGLKAGVLNRAAKAESAGEYERGERDSTSSADD